MNKKIPVWVLFSLIPFIGSLGTIYAGIKINRFSWINTGIFLTTLNIVLSSTHLVGFVWLGQIAIAFCLKDEFSGRISDSQQLERATQKIDINNCSKDDLVYGLGLPIVYANEIESARLEGYIFTHFEELADIAGIPDYYRQQLEPLVTFNYYFRNEADFSWRKCNTLSKEELIACNIEPSVVAKIIAEREQKGLYRSFPELRKRTGLPLQKLTALL